MVAEKNRATNEPIIPESVIANPAWFRLIDQLNWYDHKSQHCQLWYKRLKVTQVIFAALIPATSLLPEICAKWMPSVFGVLITVLEAIQQLNQYSTLWFSYRATAERLKYEKYLFLSGAGAYKGLLEQDRLVALAERVEKHISTEHANWFNETRNATMAQNPR